MPSALSQSANPLMTDDEIDAYVEKCKTLPVDLNPKNQVSIELGLERQYVLMGLLRVEMRLRAAWKRVFALDAIELVVTDESGAVVFHQRPRLSGVEWERGDFREYPDIAFFGATKDNDGVVELAIPPACVVAKHQYLVKARLLRRLAPAVVASGVFTTRAATEGDRQRRQEMGVDPYIPNVINFLSDADFRPELAIALANVPTEDPWRGVILLAHLYGGADEPSSLPAAVFARLGDGAFQYTVEQSRVGFGPKDPDSSIVAMRKFRLERGPAAEPWRRGLK